MKTDEISRRVAALLADPDRLATLLNDLGLDGCHHPNSGTFRGVLRDGRPFVVHHRETETGTEQTYWHPLDRDSREPTSILKLISLTLGVSVRAAADWVVARLGYDCPEDLPEARPRRTIVVTETWARAAKALSSPHRCQGVVFYNDVLADRIPPEKFRRVRVDEVVAEDYLRRLGRDDLSTCKIEPTGARYERLKGRDDLAVGSDGLVLRRDARTRVWTLLEPSVSKDDGHLFIAAGARLRYDLAKLVLETFRGPAPEPGMVVAFADGDPANCTLANLSWAPKPTPGKRGGRGAKNGHAKLDDAQVAEIRRLHAAGTRQKVFAERFGVSAATISRIIKGETWVHLDDPAPTVAEAACEGPRQGMARTGSLRARLAEAERRSA